MVHLLALIKRLGDLLNAFLLQYLPKKTQIIHFPAVKQQYKEEKMGN